jgi:hypothetical protein
MPRRGDWELTELHERGVQNAASDPGNKMTVESRARRLLNSREGHGDSDPSTLKNDLWQ